MHLLTGVVIARSMSKGVINTISELILLQENRIRMESEDIISVLVQRIKQLQEALQASNEKLSDKTKQLNWVFAKYIEMKDKVLRNGQLGISIKQSKEGLRVPPHRDPIKQEETAHIQKKRRIDPQVFVSSSSSTSYGGANISNMIATNSGRYIDSKIHTSMDYINSNVIGCNNGVMRKGGAVNSKVDNGSGDGGGGNSGTSRSSESGNSSRCGSRSSGSSSSNSSSSSSTKGGINCSSSGSGSVCPRGQESVPSGTAGKFVGELSRSKAARAALPGHECQDCKKFYEAMMQQGIFGPDDKTDMLQQCSRHKATWYA